MYTPGVPMNEAEPSSMEKTTRPMPKPMDRHPREPMGERPMALQLTTSPAQSESWLVQPVPSDWGPREELANWLYGPPGNPFEWDSWCTFTFGEKFGPDGPSPDRALYHFRNFREQTCPRAPCFAAVETGRIGGRAHLHALWRLSPLPRSAVWRAWFKRYGRAELKPYDLTRGMDAAYYISKYLTKAPLHWNIWHFHP